MLRSLHDVIPIRACAEDDERRSQLSSDTQQRIMAMCDLDKNARPPRGLPYIQ
jgi:hypothetical protein